MRRSEALSIAYEVLKEHGQPKRVLDLVSDSALSALQQETDEAREHDEQLAERHS